MKFKFRPRISRIKLNPEQAVLGCSCYSDNRKLTEMVYGPGYAPNASAPVELLRMICDNRVGLGYSELVWVRSKHYEVTGTSSIS